MLIAIKDFIKPELFVLVFVLYIIGVGIKNSKMNDTYIPFILGIISIGLCGIWIVGTCEFHNYRDIFMGIFTTLVQGVLIAGASVYANQLVKQFKKVD